MSVLLVKNLLLLVPSMPCHHSAELESTCGALQG